MNELIIIQILSKLKSQFTKGFLNNGVVGESDSLLVDLSVASLVDELADRLKIRVTPSNVGLGNSQHVDCGLVETHERAIVDLTQTQQLEGLAHFRVNSVNTLK